MEHLYPVQQCVMCVLNPVAAWTAPCGHVGCSECWSSWLDNGNQACPLCSDPFDRALFDADRYAVAAAEHQPAPQLEPEPESDAEQVQLDDEEEEQKKPVVAIFDSSSSDEE